jgi:hypothetical protein
MKYGVANKTNFGCVITIEENGRILFDRPNPTAGCSANGRRRGISIEESDIKYCPLRYSLCNVSFEMWKTKIYGSCNNKDNKYLVLEFLCQKQRIQFHLNL